MRDIQTWLAAYGESHKHPMNKLLHWFGIPLIMLSLVGLLWAIPMHGSGVLRYLNTATVIAILIVLYYFRLSARMAIGMVVVFVVMLTLVAVFEGVLGAWFVWTMAALFVVGWVFQFIGHLIEGKKPSFFEDLQFLLIGPLWLLADLYRRAGIRI